MYFRLAKRMLMETDKRLLWKLGWNMGFKGWRSVQKHKRRLKKGKFLSAPTSTSQSSTAATFVVPAAGSDVAAKQHKIDVDAMNRMITSAKKNGQLVFWFAWRRAVHSTKSFSRSSKPIPMSIFKSSPTGTSLPMRLPNDCASVETSRR